jgi:hypothetical protein
MPWKTEVLQIPFERAWLPGYFMRPPVSAVQPRKTVIVLTGFDGTAEELYFQTGAAALERGWNVLLAEGPGRPRDNRSRRFGQDASRSRCRNPNRRATPREELPTVARSLLGALTAQPTPEIKGMKRR